MGIKDAMGRDYIGLAAQQRMTDARVQYNPIGGDYPMPPPPAKENLKTIREELQNDVDAWLDGIID